MLFLIEYDRRAGELKKIRQFRDSQRDAADAARAALELELIALGSEREVVVLEAATKSALRKTHRRYFESLEELADVSNFGGR
jgi:hypothetical protein